MDGLVEGLEFGLQWVYDKSHSRTIQEPFQTGSMAALNCVSPALSKPGPLRLAKLLVDGSVLFTYSQLSVKEDNICPLSVSY